MRRYILPFDVWVCLALGCLVALGTGKIAEQVTKVSYDAVAEARAPVDGEIGGRVEEKAFQAQSVDDLLSHETFTVASHGIEYRNLGGGYYDGRYFQALTLPSGERVAAWINEESVTSLGEDYFTSDKLLPMGRVIYEDLTQSESFLEQIEYSEPLSRHDFYVDMVGETAIVSEEDTLNTAKMVTQVVTVLIVLPLTHMLGSKLGLWGYYFPPKKKKEAEWE